jgi:hypothetical protein
MMALRFAQRWFWQQLGGWASRGLALQAVIDPGFGPGRGAHRLIEIEFQDPGHHQHGLGPATVFKQGKPQRFGAINKQAPTQSGLVTNNPVAAAVPADHEQVVLRGRFNILAHDTSLSMSSTNLFEAVHAMNV